MFRGEVLWGRKSREKRDISGIHGVAEYLPMR